MKREPIEVQPGDVLAVDMHHTLAPRLHTVERVTATWAICGRSRFRLKDGREMGSGGTFHGHNYARKATPEDREAVNRWSAAYRLAKATDSPRELYKRHDLATLRAALELLAIESDDQ